MRMFRYLYEKQHIFMLHGKNTIIELIIKVPLRKYKRAQVYNLS